jgi:hypothetical protein
MALRLRQGRYAASLLAAVFLILAAAVIPAGPRAAAGTPASGDVVGAPAPLRNVPPAISAIATGRLLVYRMPGIRGSQVNATAMLFVPRTPPPAGGWPLLVWGHGTVGWAPECAPSVQLEQHGVWADGRTATLLAAVLRMGIVVVAPDYEGLGPAADHVRPGHGYYDLPSEGKSMIFAAVAAQRDLGARLSGQWVPAGWSEGGFAALAAAYYSGAARAADPSLDYRGTITLAPVPDIPAMNKILWGDIARASQPGHAPTPYQIDQLVFANAETIYFTETERYAGYNVSPGQVYGPGMLRIYSQDGRACLDSLNTIVTQDIQRYLTADPSHTLASYPGIRGNAPNMLPVNERFYAQNQGKLENSVLPGPILWLYGTSDITSPPAVTYGVVNKMLAHGNDINLAVLTGASHYDVPVAGLPLITARLAKLLGIRG